MSRLTRAIAGGIAGGLLAGALVGGTEALVGWLHAHGTGELPALGWALVAYGVLGAAGGIGAGILAALFGTDGFALAFAAIGAPLAVVVARFRIIRDVFLEQAPRGPIALVVQLAAVLVVAVLAFVVWRMLRGAGTRRALLTRPMMAAMVIAILAGAWAGASSLVPAPQTARHGDRSPAPADAPNVLLVMVDTLRADHLSSYDASHVQTPHIDRLAREGTRYAHAFAQASWTRPSVATILTGLYPSSHGAVHKADLLPNRVDTLAEQLQRGGYQTVGFANNANVSQAFNFQQGFDEYVYLAPSFFFGASEPAAQLTLYSGLRLVRERFLARSVDVHNYYQPAEVVTDEVKRWLAKRAPNDPPFFLFAHYMDPHDPYMVHPFNGEGYARVANPNPPAALAEKLHRAYAGEVAYLDEHLGALFADLEARGLWERTLVILTSDHGEEFQEHGGWWHGTTLYDEQIHVPLLVKGPGKSGGRVADELATSLDIAPTVLSAAKLPLPDTLQGHVLPLDGGEVPARASVFSEEDLEGNVLLAVRTPKWKLINANPGNPRGLAPEELYHVEVDPAERDNLHARATGELQGLRTELGRSMQQARAHAGATEQGGSDAATQERLRALGYVN